MSNITLDPKQVSRIASQLNADHRRTLYYYLKYFKKEDAILESCKITSLDPYGLVIQYKPAAGGPPASQNIHFDKPVNDLSEMDRTLKNMRLIALDALGLSRYEITTYRFGAGQAFTLGMGMALYGTCLTSLTITPAEAFLRRRLSAEQQLIAMAALPTLHLLMWAFTMRPMLYRYRVPLGMRWVWSAATLLCGWPTIAAMRQMVQEQEQEWE